VTANPPTQRLTFPALQRRSVATLQFNIGRLCNQACRHCHVDSSPARSGPEDNARDDVVADVLALLEREPGIRTLDLTGGAPELHPEFRALVIAARKLSRTVFVRHNLTVQFEPGQHDLPQFFAEQGVTLFCSLPCYLEENVNKQRGKGVFATSLQALQRLNEAGFGKHTERELHLVYNPVGTSLPPPQLALEADYRRILRRDYAIEFTRLLTITNQPIHRFRDDLLRQGKLQDYFAKLEDAFNHATLDGVMCRDSLSVRWDGQLFDCDFNLVQGLGLAGEAGPKTLRQLLETGLATVQDCAVATARHCFACTAGAGSTCGGAVVS